MKTGGTLQGIGRIDGKVDVNGGGTLAAGNSIESLATGVLSMAANSTFAYEINKSVAANLSGDLTAVSGSLTLANTDDVILSLYEIGGSGAWSVGDKLTLISYTGDSLDGLFKYGASALADDSIFNYSDIDWRFNYNDTDAGDNYADDLIGNKHHHDSHPRADRHGLWPVGAWRPAPAPPPRLSGKQFP